MRTRTPTLTSPEPQAGAYKAIQAKGGASKHKESAVKDVAEPTDYKLNYALLRVPSSELLPQIDPARREAYLADDDFVKILGTPRAEFEALPAWKRKSIKQGVGLF